jgi:hypothetical protein
MQYMVNLRPKRSEEKPPEIIPMIWPTLIIPPQRADVSRVQCLDAVDLNSTNLLDEGRHARDVARCRYIIPL